MPQKPKTILQNTGGDLIAEIYDNIIYVFNSYIEWMWK